MTSIAGRHQEQGALRQAIDGVVDMRPCAWLVHGEPGVGKTRLVADLCRESEERGFTVLWGTCVHFGAAGSPYAPLVPAFEHWLAGTDDLTRRQAAADLEAMADAAADPGDSRGILHAVPRLLGRIGARGPVLLVVDDLQWADVSSLDVLAYIIAGFDRQRLGVLVTYRDTELPDGHPLHGWLADLRRLRGVHDLPLHRLAESGTEEQLAGLLGRSPSPRLVSTVHERSGGNPYLTELLVRDLRPNADALDDDLPGELRDVLLATWHRLGPRARQVIRLLAVGGRPLPYSTFTTVATVAGQDPAVVAASLAEGTRAGVLQVSPGAGYWFRHPLLAEVLYATFMPGEAAQGHAAFAEVLEQATADDESEEMQLLADLALHHEGSGSPDPAFAYSIKAAECALRLQGRPEMAMHLLRAVELLPAVESETLAAVGGELTLLERAAYACSRAGEPFIGHRLITRALAKVDRRADPLRATRLLNDWCLLVWLNGMVEQPPLAQHLEAVELSAARPDSPEHAQALARLAAAECWTGMVSRAEQHAEEAVAAARRSGSADAMAVALGTRSVMHVRDERAWADAVAAWDWARKSGDPLVMMTACATRMDYLAAHGRVNDLLAVEAEGFTASAHSGSRDAQALFAGMAALHAMELGRFDQSRAWLREGLTLRSSGHGGAWVRRAAASLATREGRLEEAQDHLSRLVEIAPAFEGRVGVGPLVFAEYLLAKGDPEAALKVVERNLVEHSVVDPRQGDSLLLWGARAAADLVRRGADAGDAELTDRTRERLAGLLESRKRLSVPPFEPTDDRDLVAPAFAALFRGEVARCDAPSGSPELWDAAAEACARAGLRWDEAVALHWLGRSLLESGGDRSDAAEALRSAHVMAQEMRATPLAQEAETAAQAARISLMPLPRPSNGQHDGSPLHSLTRRELEVLAHLVAGRSYVEIARALYISDKTVSVHVSNMLRKTGTRNRNEAAALGRRHGIVP